MLGEWDHSVLTLLSGSWHGSARAGDHSASLSTGRGSNLRPMSGGFRGCYLLVSQHLRCKGRTYIGRALLSTAAMLALSCWLLNLPVRHRFTVNPIRRIRQHNGEVVSGAAKTKR